jgi:nicotinic acid phosphoribosyltransferase
MSAVEPENGDLIVRSTHRTEAVFAVTVWGTAAHATMCATYGDALTLAHRTAVATRAAVWYSDDGVSFHLLSTYR